MINISTKKIIKLLVIITLVLTLLSLLFSFIRSVYPNSILANCLNQLFNTNIEANIPTYFSSLLIFINSILLCAIGYYEKLKKFNYWYFLSGLFLIASIDELAQIHEISNKVITGYSITNNLFYSGWVSLWFIFVVAIFFLCLKFIFSLPKNTRNLFLLAGTIYVFSALGLELIGGYFYYHKFIYKIFSSSEEFLEMMAMVMFIKVFLDYLKKIKTDIKIIISN